MNERENGAESRDHLKISCEASCFSMRKTAYGFSTRVLTYPYANRRKRGKVQSAVFPSLIITHQFRYLICHLCWTGFPLICWCCGGIFAAHQDIGLVTAEISYKLCPTPGCDGRSEWSKSVCLGVLLFHTWHVSSLVLYFWSSFSLPLITLLYSS